MRLLISCVPGLLGSGLPRQPQPSAGSGCGAAGWPGHGGSYSPSPAEGWLLPAPGSAQGHEPVPCSQQGSRARDPWGPCPRSARTQCCPLGPDPTQLWHRGAGNRLTPICSWWELHQSGAVYCIRGMLPSNQLSGRPSPDLIPTLAGLCACPVFLGGGEVGCWQDRTSAMTVLSLAKSLLLGGATACMSGTGGVPQPWGHPAPLPQGGTGSLGAAWEEGC